MIVERSDHDYPYQHLRLPYFVYGTLRPGCGNDRRWRTHHAKAIGDGEATVKGFAMYASGIPYVVEAHDEPNATVVGALILPPASLTSCMNMRDDLDRLESWPRHYDRVVVDVRVTGFGRPIEAWMYSPANIPTNARRVLTGDFLKQYATMEGVSLR